MLDTTAISTFAENGVICVPNVLEKKWLTLLRDGIEKNNLDRGPWSCEYTQTGQSGNFWDDYCNWQRFSEYQKVLFESPLAKLAQQVMETSEVRLFHEHVLVKEAETNEETPWHHDQPYYCVDGNQLVSTWVPLDPIELKAAPRFIAGSHHGPMYAPRNFVDHEHYEYEGYDPIPEIDEKIFSEKIISWEMQPGDVLIFHMRTLHAAGGSSATRRAFAARWLGDDARYAKRPGPTSPPFPELEGVLQPGDPMVHKLFPIVIP